MMNHGPTRTGEVLETKARPLVMSFDAAVFLLGGAVFLLVSCVGLLRLPDFYTRAHAVGKAEMLGSVLIFLGGLSITARR